MTFSKLTRDPRVLNHWPVINGLILRCKVNLCLGDEYTRNNVGNRAHLVFFFFSLADPSDLRCPYVIKETKSIGESGSKGRISRHKKVPGHQENVPSPIRGGSRVPGARLVCEGPPRPAAAHQGRLCQGELHKAGVLCLHHHLSHPAGLVVCSDSTVSDKCKCKCIL